MEPNEKRNSFNNDYNLNIDPDQINSANKLSEGMTKHKEKFSLFKGITWENEGKTIVTSPYLLSQPSKVKIIKELLLSETPIEYRKIFWLNASGALREKNNNPNVYYNLLNNYPKFMPSPYTNQIEVDLKRTFSDSNNNINLKEQNIEKLRNILLAFSRRNVSIGYVQGFNFIVGKLLMLFDSEEDVFWLFTQLLEQFLPLEYFSELAGLMNDCVVATFILQKELPEVVNHLTNLGNEMCLNNILFQWFDSLFVQNIPEEIWLNIWDFLFLEGNVSLFKAAISIFRLMKSKILETKSMEDLFPLLEEGVHDVKSNKFMKEMMKMKPTEELNTIDDLRKFFLQRTIETLEKSYKIKANLKNIPEPNENECEVIWPLCVKEIKKINIMKVSVIRQYHRVCIEEDFFDNNVNDKKKEFNEKHNHNERYLMKGNAEMKIFKAMLIERRVHTCDHAKTESFIESSDSESYSSLSNSHKGSSAQNYLQTFVASSYFDSDSKPEQDIANIIQKVKTSKSAKINIAISKPEATDTNTKKKKE